MSTRSRRGLGTWLTASHSPLFVLDERRVVLVFNKGCEELTQWPAAEIIGKTCHLQSAGDPAHWSSVTGALSPPPDLGGSSFLVQRVPLLRRDGMLLERDIHFFQLTPEVPDDGRHLLGFITEPAADINSTPPRRLDVARHVAFLHEKYRLDRLVARTPAMQRVAAQIQLARSVTATVHIAGERGTGREHVARLIHYGSPERQQRFVPIRCQQSSQFEIQRALNRLYDSEVTQEPVSIYLDEVQMLNRDLQDRVATMVSQSRHRHYSSSSMILAQMNDSQLSQELRLRLTSLTIEVPPLRERSEDLPLLAQQLLEEQNQTSETQKLSFSPALERALLLYNWPGNVNELGRVLQQAVSRAKESIIDVPDLPPDFNAGMTAQAMRPMPVRSGLDDAIANFERHQIEQALQDARGNKSQAADLLKIPRAKLYRRMASLGLATPDDEEPPVED